MLAVEEITDADDADLQEVVDYIWRKKYKYRADGSLDDTKCRVARTAASAEEAPAVWEEKFRWLLDFFLPGGRVMNALGTSRSKCTAMNCFVSPVIEDSMEGIFSVLHKAALTMQAGGGIGFDFSTLRPKDAPVLGVGSTSSGPISFMQVYDAMCRTISSSGHRRGAMMAVMRVDHPDIERFVTAKRGSENDALVNFNLSVLITDRFMEAVKNNGEWRLVFGGKVYKTVSARALWDQILAHAYDYAEPGVLFIDRINRLNNLYYCEEIHATNPCGEQPLPPNGACNLGSINLTRFVRSPFQNPEFDYDLFHKTIKTAVRFLDNVVDVARLPLKEQRDEVVSKRRVGLGITGLADMLWMMGIQYGSAEALVFCDDLARLMRDTAYRTSVELAQEKGCFPLFDPKKYLAGEFVRDLPADIRNDMQKYGVRNSHLLSIAPTGTTSLLWGNISSGIEPIFDLEVKREIKDNEEMKTVQVKDYAYYVWRKINGDNRAPDVLTAPKINA
ncbi:MAG: adenosylcobalamin-dependent ribonucleoside-diphosphate reductase, partial [Deferribacteres bacterium]|nr:adenosylcobalamin-dependent ribonucleoside-diphosphate reductase [Deferribacteres bacterium]